LVKERGEATKGQIVKGDHFFRIHVFAMNTKEPE
jgi:hypothetical protein